MIEDLEQDVGLIYGQMGRKGLESIENVGPRLAEVIEDLVNKSISGLISPFDRNGLRVHTMGVACTISQTGCSVTIVDSIAQIRSGLTFENANNGTRKQTGALHSSFVWWNVSLRPC